MELFTLGIGNYTEDDVKAGARALTGWTVDRAHRRRQAQPRAARRRRQDDPRRDRRVRRRRRSPTCWSPQPATRDVPGRAALVPVRLRRRRSPAETHARLVAAYGAAATSTALLRALFDRPGVRRRPAGQLVKQPVEWVVGAMRQLGIRPGELPEQQRKQLVGGLARLDQVPFAPAERRRLAGRRGLADHVSARRSRLRAADLLAGAGGAGGRWTGSPPRRRPAGRRAGPAARRRRLDRPHPRGARRRGRPAAAADRARPGQPRVHGPLRSTAMDLRHPAQVPHRQRRRRRRRARGRRRRVHARPTSSTRPADADRRRRHARAVTLYGGNDGLNTVIPYADPAYQDARPELAYDAERGAAPRRQRSGSTRR